MKSNLISKSETAEVLRDIAAQWRIEIPRPKNLRVYHLESGALLFDGPEIRVLQLDGTLLPFLSETTMLTGFPRVVVDMGAVRFMCGGANVMRPGIASYTKFAKGDIVCVSEESKGNFLAVGKALVDSAELDGMERGKVVKNLHYISDKYWEAGKILFR